MSVIALKPISLPINISILLKSSVILALSKDLGYISLTSPQLLPRHLTQHISQLVLKRKGKFSGSAPLSYTERRISLQSVSFDVFLNRYRIEVRTLRKTDVCINPLLTESSPHENPAYTHRPFDIAILTSSGESSLSPLRQVL